jgi:predicted RNA-binding protein associated with RNAse of E/G family
MFREGELFQQYIDMTLQNVVPANGAALFQDLILDVVILGDGSPRVMDRDELEDALRRGWITQEEYALALKTAEDVIGFYRAHGAQIAMKLREYRSMMKSSMREGSAWGF